MRSKQEKPETGRLKSSGGDSQSRRGRALGNEHRQAQKTSGAQGAPPLHLLAGQLRNISLLEKGMTFKNFDRQWYRILAKIETEAAQLQCISDLHEIVLAQPKYKDMKPMDWPADMSPIQVILKLLRKLGPLAQGKSWYIDTWKDGRKTRFRYVTVQPFASQCVNHNSYCIRLDFLPWLLGRDQVLHDAILAIVALVSRRCHLPLWDEDEDYAPAIATFLNEKPILKNFGELGYLQTNESRPELKEIYTTGIAQQYLRTLRSTRRYIKAEHVLSIIKGYDFDFGKERNWFGLNRKQRIGHWIMNGLHLAETGGDLKHFTYVPDHLPQREHAITPRRLYSIVWTLDNRDPTSLFAREKFQADAELAGLYIPTMFSIAYPGQKLPPIKPDLFPEEFCVWLQEFDSLFLHAHKDYFYKTDPAYPYSPTEDFMYREKNNLSKKVNIKRNERSADKQYIRA